MIEDCHYRKIIVKIQNSRDWIIWRGCCMVHSMWL
jgi:hypothetical protein